MASRPLIKGSLKLLDIAGSNPDNYNKWSLMRATVCVIALLVVCVDLLLQCHYNWKGLSSMDGLGVFIGVLQVAVKIAVMNANYKFFLRLFNYMESFWPTDKYGQELHEELQESVTVMSKYINMGLTISIVTETFYFIKPFLSRVRTLPFDMYHPRDMNTSPDYELVYLGLFLTVLFNTPAMLGFDVLFISIIINITWELKIIKRGLANLPIRIDKSGDDQESFEELIQLIDHHNLVMKCIRELDGIYFTYLLNLFLANMLCICSGLLCIVASGFPSSYDVLTKYGLFIILFSSEIYFYCLGGTHLMSACEGVSDAIYESNWWIKTQPKLRNAYVLVIQRANKIEKLKAGGMITLNLYSFTSMLRMALSFFTMINALYSK